MPALTLDDYLSVIQVDTLETPLQASDNIDWNFPQDFLDAFHATRGLCPANPEGDYGFMHFLLMLCELYDANHVAVPATLTSLLPNTAAAGGPEFLLDIIGTGLVAGSILNFGTATGPITYISDQHAQALVQPAAYALPGTIAVTVQVPGGVADSNSLSFTAT